MTDFSESNILAIDTSSSVLKLALSFGGDRLVKSSEEVKQSHGQFLIKKIGELLQSADLDRKEIDALVVSVGPGSFTGLRIGLSAAKGMSVALDIPLVGVGMFEVAAYRLGKLDDPVGVVIPLTRDQVFVAAIKDGKSDPASVAVVSKTTLVHDWSATQLTGIGGHISTCLPDIANILPPGEIEYDASHLLHLGLEKLERGDLDDISDLEPAYLQKSQAELRFEQHHSDK